MLNVSGIFVAYARSVAVGDLEAKIPRDVSAWPAKLVQRRVYEKKDLLRILTAL